MKIKFKLIIIFILMKVIPLVIITIIAVNGVYKLNDYFLINTKNLVQKNKDILQKTTNDAIDKSIVALDNKSQESLEKFSVLIASKIADFLYERDKDILFLSKIIDKNNFKKIIDNFYLTKTNKILVHSEYIYDEKTKIWIKKKKNTIYNKQKNTILEDNKRNFHFINPHKLNSKKIPTYKEISFFDLNGDEIYKKSSISSKLVNISNSKNTYCKAENYFNHIKNLKNGEIYVSDVIGAYVPSKLIGNFTKEKAKKMKIDFKPEFYGYAGIENPNGKRFEGIIRFVTPIYKNNKKIAYISLALDHRHIMEFTDTFNPIDPNIKQDIANARDGNYAFMWDYKARNISHPRDYFIVGFDPKTGRRVTPWLSKQIAEEFKRTKQKDINKFLDNYPKFLNQSLKQKPNISQLLKDGNIALDCRYLNFAPQCQGWMELTKNGGYGSFIIFWSKVWKLSTAATIPYYTGQYSQTKRGFGFVTIGANVNEFHKVANSTKSNIDKTINEQFNKMENLLNESEKKVDMFIEQIIKDLSFSTIIMILLVIIIAIWMSNFITNRIKLISKGIEQFSKNNLDYRLPITSNDEIGELEKSFNKMAQEIKKEQKSNKQKEILLMEQSKMASMGNMIANIAHQWRQPLSVISTIASGSIVKSELNILDDKSMIADMEKIVQSTTYLSETIDTFRDFIKENKEKKEFIYQERMDKAIDIVKASLESSYINIRKNINYNDEIKSVIVGAELVQVIINILNNAKDALNEKNIENKYIEISLNKNNNIAIISIEDNAGGIPNHIIDKIFEPYFTTKHKSKGTGLGLHMSYKIISETLHGKLYVKNTKNGAKFFIEIPLNN